MSLSVGRVLFECIVCCLIYIYIYRIMFSHWASERYERFGVLGVLGVFRSRGPNLSRSAYNIYRESGLNTVEFCLRRPTTALKTPRHKNIMLGCAEILLGDPKCAQDCPRMDPKRPKMAPKIGLRRP